MCFSVLKDICHVTTQSPSCGVNGWKHSGNSDLDLIWLLSQTSQTEEVVSFFFFFSVMHTHNLAVFVLLEDTVTLCLL